jgi:hypothetical protein
MLAAADTAADAATDAEAETVAGGNVGDAGFSDGDCGRVGANGEWKLEKGSAESDGLAKEVLRGRGGSGETGAGAGAGDDGR